MWFRATSCCWTMACAAEGRAGEGTRIHTTVTVAGPLSNNKGINKKGGGLSAPALTEKDKGRHQDRCPHEWDYLAVSFPRCGDDLRYARELAREAGSNAKIVAKVERAETAATDEAMEDIILGSDAVMVARGDLGVEIGDPELVGVQKKLIRHSRRLNRVVITATQMMESMINAPLPTRAEVMDVANAVAGWYRCGDALCRDCCRSVPHRDRYLHGELLCRCREAPEPKRLQPPHELHLHLGRRGGAMSTMYAANHLEGSRRSWR